MEEILQREVILRFRIGVDSQRLVCVSVDDEDNAQVNAGMSKCSDYVHGKVMIGGFAVPDPAELLTNILAKKNWRAKMHKRSEETAKKRKAVPPIAVRADMQGASLRQSDREFSRRVVVPLGL